MLCDGQLKRRKLSACVEKSESCVGYFYSASFICHFFLKVLAMNKFLKSSLSVSLVIAASAFAVNAQAAAHSATAPAAPASAASGAKVAKEHAKGPASGAKHAKSHASGVKHSSKAASKPEMKKEEAKK